MGGRAKRSGNNKLEGEGGLKKGEWVLLWGQTMYMGFKGSITP